MAEKEKNVDIGDVLISWQIPEFDKHKREMGWYIIAGIVAILLLIYSFFTGNFLFAVIIIVAALVIILHDGREPMKIGFSITDEGVIVGKKFHDFDDLKDFSIIFKPRQNIKNLYFEFKTVIRPRLSIPLLKMDPLPIRKILLKYLPEDLERTDQPLSEFLGKLFKL